MVWGGIAAALAGGILGGASSRRTNKANRAMSREQMKFQARQGEIARTYNSAEALKQRNWASEQAEYNRQFQRDMSDTAVQRRMEDLRNAGINPILAGKFDATSPPGSTLSGSVAAGSPSAAGAAIPAVDEGASAFSNAIRTLELGRIEAGIKNLEAQTKKTKAEAEVTEKEVPTAQALEKVKQGVIDEVTEFIEKHSKHIPNFIEDKVENLRKDVGDYVDQVNEFFLENWKKGRNILKTKPRREME